MSQESTRVQSPPLGLFLFFRTATRGYLDLSAIAWDNSFEAERPVVYTVAGTETVLSGGADADNPVLEDPMIILSDTSYLVIRDLTMKNGGGDAIRPPVFWADTKSSVNQRKVVLDRLTVHHFRGAGISIRGYGPAYRVARMG